MSLTAFSSVFICTRQQAEEVAQMANLRHDPYIKDYDLWEDKATGGGGCRIVWKCNVAWISRHSGYPQADITEEVKFFFQEVLHCNPYEYDCHHLNPNIYGFDRWVRDPKTWEWKLP